ncbi:MAG: hypothetical protein J6D03_01270 [Clostridia bacterium]|nr:hypothetical protein [Clostridia bacterium]
MKELEIYKNGGQLSKEQLKSIYDYAKEEYYNGTTIMEDYEFDELEKLLGLENKSYVGTKHNPSYTIKHPFIMGSLDKIQIHQREDGNVYWEDYIIDVYKYVEPHMQIIVTPKYDGCSFEAVIKDNKVISISSRGDGHYGKDYYSHLIDHVNKAITTIEFDEYVVRGEVLINKNTFKEKYSEFVNPRSFVSGILNRDYTEDIKHICDDLDIVIYDIRVKKDNTWKDIDWNCIKFGNTKYAPQFYRTYNTIDIEKMYEEFLNYRINVCEYALDGIVIKPIEGYRIDNVTKSRPKDCVAIKFMPILEETTVRDIQWNLGKSNEYIPVVITDPVIMDGKSVTKAKANNIGYLMNNKISIGTKIIFSLAGDIIPYIYKVTDTTKFNPNNINIPSNAEVDGIHLMANLSIEDMRKQCLKNSLNTLNINKLGSVGIESVVEWVSNNCKGDEFFDIECRDIPINVFYLKPSDFENAIGGKIGKQVSKEFEKLLKDIDLKTIIKSCTFKLCGDKVVSQIENYMLGRSYSFASMSREAYEWCMDENSNEMNTLKDILDAIGYSIDDFKNRISIKELHVDNQIPVILTGEPNNYKSKGEFLKMNPKYKLTSSWKEVKIVFTNSMKSNTGKMKKAKEKNIEIQLY